jgi:hypothetical protein
MCLTWENQDIWPGLATTWEAQQSLSQHHSLASQTELVYSLQGAAIDRTQNIYLNYHYLNLPVLAKAYFYEDASFEIGMQYGFLMKAVNKSDIYSDEITSQVNRHDFAAVFGLNYKLGDSFNFGLRYNLGITNTPKTGCHLRKPKDEPCLANLFRAGFLRQS